MKERKKKLQKLGECTCRQDTQYITVSSMQYNGVARCGVCCIVDFRVRGTDMQPQFNDPLAVTRFVGCNEISHENIYAVSEQLVREPG